MLRRRSVFVVFAIAALAAGVLSGAGVRQGVIVPLTRQIDIAPTVARLLGFTMANVDGVPLAGVIVDTVRPEAAVSSGR